MQVLVNDGAEANKGCSTYSFPYFCFFLYCPLHIHYHVAAWVVGYSAQPKPYLYFLPCIFLSFILYFSIVLRIIAVV